MLTVSALFAALAVIGLLRGWRNRTATGLFAAYCLWPLMACGIAWLAGRVVPVWTGNRLLPLAGLFGLTLGTVLFTLMIDQIISPASRPGPGTYTILAAGPLLSGFLIASPAAASLLRPAVYIWLLLTCTAMIARLLKKSVFVPCFWLPLAAVLSYCGLVLTAVSGWQFGHAQIIVVVIFHCCSLLFPAAWLSGPAMAVRPGRDETPETLHMQSALLRLQINPHFIHNTLNSISALINFDGAKAQRLINRFSNYLRTNAAISHQDALTTLGNEIVAIENYLEIEQVRYDDRLHYTINCPPDVLNTPVPPLSLLTFVENSVLHGLHPKPEGGHIELTARRTPHAVTVIIEDDGVGVGDGFDIGHFIGNGQSIGVRNSYLRLVRLCSARVAIGSRSPSGTTVTVTIPCEVK
ncbi:MAG: histidine kinase [Negativicutes bacterium]|nr:histidine kinase [Negativicutes bacterium]